MKTNGLIKVSEIKLLNAVRVGESTGGRTSLFYALHAYVTF